MIPRLEKANIAKTVKIAEVAEIAEIAEIADIAEIAEIAETGTGRFLETFKIWVFFRKIDGLLEESLLFIQNRSTWQICCRMRIKRFCFSKMSSTLFLRFVWQKNQETFNVGIFRNYDEERVLFREKKRFHFFKSQIMPVVAGRLVLFYFVTKDHSRCSCTAMFSRGGCMDD